MSEQIYTYSELETAARRLARSTSFRAIMQEVEALRKAADSASDNGYLSWEELEKYYADTFGYSSNRIPAVKKFVLEHREPAYPANTVVMDADGVWYRRFSNGWAVFGSNAVTHLDYPKRPLKVMG